MQQLKLNSFFITFFRNIGKNVAKYFFVLYNRFCMKNIEKLLEIEALTENLTKHLAKNNLLKIKVLYFVDQYQNLSVSMIIDKLGLKKSNFANITKELEADGLILSRQGELDKRCRLMALTPKGKAELDKYQQGLKEFFSENNPQVDHAIETLCAFLNKKI